MSMEDLRSYYQIHDSIRLELSNDPTASTVGEADGDVYCTREQFTARLRFPMSSLVNQFLHVSWAPPALIHSNSIRILMGYSVLNLFYRLDISLVEICIVYMPKLGTGGKLLMSTHNPKL